MKSWFTLERQVWGLVLSVAVFLGHIYVDAAATQMVATGLWCAFAAVMTITRAIVDSNVEEAAGRLLKRSHEPRWNQVRGACKDAKLDLEKLFPRAPS